MKKKILLISALAFLATASVSMAAEVALPSYDGIVWFGEGAEQTDSKALVLSDGGDHQYEEAGTAENDDLCLVGGSIFFLHRDQRPAVAVIIDDMGLDRKRTARALKLPPPVMMAYLPYSPDIQKQADQAAAKGHPLMVHLPMEPMRDSANPGPDYLGGDMTAEELSKRTEKNLSAFKGYVGVNNHMGSKMTQNRFALKPVMEKIRTRGVFFLDSKTSPKSVAEQVAREKGIPATHRDVFIDDDESAKAVARQLSKAETIARGYGTAVIIGHPKDVTLDALEKWIPALEGKGIDVVDLREIIARRDKDRQPALPAAKVAKKD